MAFLIWLRGEWDRVFGFGLMIAGAAAVFAGYQGASGSPFVADQLAYIMSGGIGGLFLLGSGATFVLLADLHDEWRKLDRVERQLHGATATIRPDE